MLALFFVFCSCAFTTHEILGGSKLQLSLRMSVSAQLPSMAQLFYDTGAGYNEAESRKVLVSASSLGDFQKLDFELPSKNISGLRFDPLTTHGTIIIRDLAIRDPKGSTVRLPVSDVLPFNQIMTTALEKSGQQVTFSTLPTASDAGVIIQLKKRFLYRRFKTAGRAPFILAGNAFLVLFVVLLNAGLRYGERVIRDSEGSRTSISDILRLFSPPRIRSAYRRLAFRSIYSDHVNTRRLSRIGLVLFVASLSFTCFEAGKVPEVQLSLEMSSSASSIAQLFYDVGHGYNEKDSQTAGAPATNHFNQLSFKLPPKKVIAFRFDPIMTEGTVVLRHVTVRTPYRLLWTIPATDIRSLNQIKTRKESGGQVTFSTIPGANDPGLALALYQPLDVSQLGHGEKVRWIILGNGLLLGLATVIFFASDTLLKLLSRLRQATREANRRMKQVAASVSNPHFIEFDSAAIWFYVICLVGFGSCALANLNGSSVAIYNYGYGYGARETPLLGLPAGIRSDEWVCHTPAILNEDLSADQFDAEHSSLGNHSIALLANVPVRHISTIFRPQFWTFFFLPLDYGFAFYWQFKGLILVAGVFTASLLITRSSFWAITASLWYFFSAFTQWTYSWPSALPEMVGLGCTALVSACYLTVGRSPVALGTTVLVAAISIIDFILCGYPPHMIPIFWVMAFLFVAWCLANRDVIFKREGSLPRAAAFLAVLMVCALIGLVVYEDARVAIAAVARTAYPGRRIFAGGTLPLQTVTSHFLQWTQTEAHFPPALSNICEASGFLWLAPVTLFGLSRTALSRFQKFALASLWISFLFVLLWLVVPFPSSMGMILGFDRTGGTRALPALGLANILIVVLCMSASAEGVRDRRGASRSMFFFRAGGILLIVFSILLLTNATLKNFFSWSELSLGAVTTTALIVLVLEARKVLLALALIVPQAFLFGAVNPIERGLGVITSSDLYGFIRAHDELRHAKWIVYSEGVVGSGFLRSSGCDVFTGFMYVPVIDYFPIFKDHGLDLRAFNRDGILIAHALPVGWKSFAEVPIIYAVRLNISPSDSMLKQLGIKYAAFEQRPSDLIASQLIPLASGPVGGIWLYRLK